MKKIIVILKTALESDAAAAVMGILLVYGYLRLALEVWDALAGVR